MSALYLSLQRGWSHLRAQGHKQLVAARLSRAFRAPAAVLAPARPGSERSNESSTPKALPTDWTGPSVSSTELVSSMVPRAELLQTLTDLVQHADYSQAHRFPAEKELEDLQQRVRHLFTTPLLLKLSLVHVSASAAGNHNLAWIGDAAMHLIVSEQLCARYLNSNVNLGDLSKVRAQLISRTNFAAQAQQLGLEQVAVVGKSVRSRGSIPHSILAEMFESVMGAIYIDAGMERCRSSYLHICPFPKSFFELQKRLKL